MCGGIRQRIQYCGPAGGIVRACPDRCVGTGCIECPKVMIIPQQKAQRLCKGQLCGIGLRGGGGDLRGADRRADGG